MIFPKKKKMPASGKITADRKTRVANLPFCNHHRKLERSINNPTERI